MHAAFQTRFFLCIDKRVVLGQAFTFDHDSRPADNERCDHTRTIGPTPVTMVAPQQGPVEAPLKQFRVRTPSDVGKPL